MITSVVFDQRLRERLMRANLDQCERVAFLLGRREGDVAEVAAAIFPPLSAAEPTRAVFDMRWFTILRTTARRLGLEPAVSMVGWMHSHPRMSIFLSATDRPTARAFARTDPEVVAVVVNPFDPEDPIGAFHGEACDVRVPVEFRTLEGFPPDLLARLAALGAALPDFNDLVLPDWLEVPERLHREAERVLHLRLLEGQRLVLHRLEAMAAKLDRRRAAEDSGIDLGGIRSERRRAWQS